MRATPSQCSPTRAPPRGGRRGPPRSGRRAATVALAAVLAVAGCGGDGGLPPRAVVPLLPLATIPPTRVWHLAEARFPLAPGDARAFALDVDAGRRLVVRVVHAAPPAPGAADARAGGPSPEVLGGPRGGPPRRLTALAGGRAEGRLDVDLVADGSPMDLVVRWPAGAAAPGEILAVTAWERPDPNDPGPRAIRADATGAGELRAFDVYGDRRPGLSVGPGESVEHGLDLPVHATRLQWAAVPRAYVTRGEPDADPSVLVVEVREEGGDGGVMSEALVPSRPAWTAGTLPLQGLAGRRVTVSLRASAGGPLAVSLPRVLCERGARRPNLVIVSIDTLRRDHLGLHGYARDTTPRLDAWAAQALVFDDALSAAPYTLPSHATIFSGRYPPGHGASHPASALDTAATPLLADVLARRGWATRAFTGGGYLSADYGFDQGFAAYSQCDPLWDPDDPRLAPRLAGPAGVALRELRGAQDWDAALAWIDDHAQVPFFLFLQTFAVHDYRPPAGHRRFATPGARPVAPLRRLEDQLVTPYTEAELDHLVDLYDGALAWTDARVGELLDRLGALGLAGHTVVVVTSDHGEEFGERGFNGHNLSLHAEQLAVPLIVAAPGVGPARIAARVSLVDLAPTLLDLLGVEAPAGMQGRSLRPLWEGAGPDWRPSPALGHVDSNVTRAAALYRDALKVVVGDPLAAVTRPAQTALRLYDVDRDPGEIDDLSARRPQVAAGLADALAALLTALAADAPDAAPVELDEETRRRLVELGYLSR